MMAPRGMRYASRVESQAGQDAVKGDMGVGKVLKNVKMIKSSRIRTIQRGTTRPLGKRIKNAKRETYPRKSMRLDGTARAG
jgi:hypothetical protein